MGLKLGGERGAELRRGREEWLRSRAARLSRSVFARALCLGAAGLVFGCVGEESLGRELPDSCSLSSTSQVKSVSLMTFWKSEHDEDSILIPLRERLAGQGVDLSTTQVSDRREQHSSIRGRMVDPTEPLPHVFQTNGGSDLLQLVDDQADDPTQICALNSLEEELRWKERLFPAALAPLRCGGELFAFPIGMHRLNMVMVNEVLAERVREVAIEEAWPWTSIEELGSAEELLEFLERVAESGLVGLDGEPAATVSMGHAEAWPSQVIAFENLLASYSLEAYRAFFSGRPGEESDGDIENWARRIATDFTRLGALSDLGTLVEGAPDEGPRKRTWSDAARRVVSGSAFFTIGGDWMLTQAGRDVDRVRLLPFPGTEELFIYTPDSFSVPRDNNSDGSEARVWFTDVMDNEATLLEFARQKNALPPFSDLSPARLSEAGFSQYLTDSYFKFADCAKSDGPCEVELAVSGLGPGAGADPCFDEAGRHLTHLAGFPTELQGAETDASPDRHCERVLPDSPEAALEEFVQLVVGVSRDRFAASCRVD